MRQKLKVFLIGLAAQYYSDRIRLKGAFRQLLRHPLYVLSVVIPYLAMSWIHLPAAQRESLIEQSAIIYVKEEQEADIPGDNNIIQIASLSDKLTDGFEEFYRVGEDRENDERSKKRLPVVGASGDGGGDGDNPPDLPEVLKHKFFTEPAYNALYGLVSVGTMNAFRARYDAGLYLLPNGARCIGFGPYEKDDLTVRDLYAWLASEGQPKKG